MKKLMIAAASAAVGLSAFAVLTPEAYEMNITLKTTACKAGQGKNVCDNDYTTYRVKANQKIQGLIWGCDCPTISDPVVFTTFDAFGNANECHGYVFWDATDKAKSPYETASFTWKYESADDNIDEFQFLQCINPKCTECEGLWTLKLVGQRLTDCTDIKSDTESGTVVSLQGAGFGTSKWNDDHLAAYVSSMSGNVTGWAFPGILSGGCAACGEIWAGCSAWAFCTACAENDCLVPSVAYGTWTLKFKADVAKKYAKGTTRDAILSAYKFPSAVKAYLIAVDQYEEPVCDCDAEKAAYDLAKKSLDKANDALDLAEATQEGVQDDVLKENLVQAKMATQYTQTNLVAFVAVSNMYGITEATWTNKGGFPLVTDTFGPSQELTLATLNSRYYSIGNTTGATNKYNTAKVTLKTAEDAVSTNKYEILIKNADGTQVFNGPVYGSKAAAEKIALNYEPAYKRTIKVTAYTLDRSSKLYPWVINPARTVDTTDLTKAWIDGNSAKWASDDAAALKKAQDAFNTAKDNLATAQGDLIPHYAARAEAYEDQIEAQNRWDNRKTLQSTAQLAVQKAQSDVDDAETAVSVAKKALDKCQSACD